MSRVVRIAPSILSADFGRLADEVAALERAGADLVHVDVMDGRFVPNITIGPPVVRALKSATRLPLDVHLMIVEPERYVADFVDAGASIVTVHAEATTHLHRTLQLISSLGAKAGVSLNPATSEEALRYVVAEVDLVLVMSVNPGFGGQRFLPFVLPKLERLRAMLDDAASPAMLEVDGGIDPSTAPLALAAGADVLVAGNAVLGKGKGKGPAEAERAYREAILALRPDARA